MNFQQILMAAATQGSGGAAAPTELFPDPNLEDVADGTNGWTLSGDLEATGGTGPGLTLNGAQDGSSAALTGADAASYDSMIAALSTKTITLTIANFVAGSVTVKSRGGLPVTYSPVGNGPVALSVLAGAGSGFEINGADIDPSNFGITHISVT